jgi:uncharacterized phage protein (TIGR02218 family)
MKTANPALRALLETRRAFYMADLYTFTLADGTTLRYTSADVPLHAAGVDYAHDGPLIKRGRTRLTLGLEVDTLDITLAADDRHLIRETPWLQAARSGALDGASVQLDRLFLDDWASSNGGTVAMFEGVVAEVEAGRTELHLTVKNALLTLLDTPLPRNVYQSGCLHTVFQGGCGLNRAAFSSGGTVTGGDLLTLATPLPQPPGYFTLGNITFTSGPNSGVSRAVREHAQGQLTLAAPLALPCRSGDTFSISPGCDGLRDTCRQRFGNEPNFRGFPFIPTPETAL